MRDLAPVPENASELRSWLGQLGLPGLVDLHVHFLPQRVLDKVWAYFDQAEQHYGTAWPIHYRYSEAERVRLLRSFGVIAFAPLAYPHKPGMAAWLTSWVREFAERTPGAVPTATIYPEPEVTEYLGAALDAGARCVKVHVQIGRYDPRDELLDAAWGMIAEAGVPAVVHCGHGPIPGKHTGLDVFESVLARHPRLTAVLAHAGMPDYRGAVDLARRYERVHIDTTMVGVEFSKAFMPLEKDWPGLLADIADKIAFGTDYPNIPYDYSRQLAAIVEWAAADDRLGEPFLRAVLHDTPSRLLGLAAQGP